MSVPTAKCVTCEAVCARACEECDKPCCSDHVARDEHECEAQDGECPVCVRKIDDFDMSVRLCVICGVHVHDRCKLSHDDDCERWVPR